MTFPTDLTTYLDAFGPLLAQQAQERSRPLHTPGKDETIDLSHLLRPPLDAQLHVITAITRAWEHEKGIMISAEMGSGKSLMAIAAADYFGRHEYRAIVMVPPHLVLKWEREIRLTLPGPLTVKQITSYKDLTRLERHVKPVGPEWYIVSQTRAKLGTAWKPAYRERIVRLPDDWVALIDAAGKYSKYRDYGDGSRIRGLYCPDCQALIVTKDRAGNVEPTKHAELAKSKRFCESCGAALWTWTNQYDRWPVAHYIKRKLPGYFDFFIIDEAHQAKSQESAIGGAMGALAASVKRSLTLSGTVFGGFAWHVKGPLFRISPQTVVESGFTWAGDTAWNEAYGRIETKVVENEAVKSYRDYNGEWNSYSIGKKQRKMKSVKPGVMPSLFGRHLIGNTVFLSLDEVADNLPALDESVIAVDMDSEQQAAYSTVEHALRDAIKKMLAKGDKRLLSTMLQTLLGYCDHPWGWGEIGYYDEDKSCAQGRIWKHVVTPPELDKKTIRPKERAVIEFCKKEKAEGRRVWLYAVMTDKRDVVGRLGALLPLHGLRTAVLRSSVETTKREEWMEKHVPDADVIVSHPQLVETGLDFFSPPGSKRPYNVPTVAFYQTGYNLFTLRQASRRAWRIGQNEDCRIRYFYYEDTMQARAMALMGKKLTASQSMEGKFSMEGLAALAGDEGTIETAMARSLVNALGEDLDVGRAWNRVGEKHPGLNAVEKRFVEAMQRIPGTKQMVMF
jgi:hypothetical protein